MTNTKVAFIGLGIMGSRMAANLLKNNVHLIAYNRSTEARKAFEAIGGKTVTTITEAVKDADIVFSMLSTPKVVEDVFFPAQGALSAMKPNAIWVDCSTVNPSFSLIADQIAQTHQIRFIDAPVAGTKPHAENAELVFFVGAGKDLLSEVEHLMNFMGRKIMHIGETSKGSSFKMLVNVMLAQSMIIFSESLLLGEKMGLGNEFLLNVLPNLVVSAPFTKFKAEMIRENNYEVQFPLELMHKDLHLATITAYEHNQPLYLANIAKELFAEANKKGMGRLDFAAIHQYLES